MDQRECRQHVYDHRLRELVRRTGDIRVATDLGVPRSTAVGWLSRELRPVVSLDVLGQSEVDLQAEVLKLRRRIKILTAVVGLLLAVRRTSGYGLEGVQIQDPAKR